MEDYGLLLLLLYAVNKYFSHYHSFYPPYSYPNPFNAPGPLFSLAKQMKARNKVDWKQTGNKSEGNLHVCCFELAVGSSRVILLGKPSISFFRVQKLPESFQLWHYQRNVELGSRRSSDNVKCLSRYDPVSNVIKRVNHFEFDKDQNVSLSGSKVIELLR